MKERRVVITGMGAVTPLGVGARSLHERWASGECGIVDGIGACKDFEPGDFLSIKEVRRLDRFSQVALVAAGEAVAQGRLGRRAPLRPAASRVRDRDGIGGQHAVEAQLDVMRERGPKMVSPLGIPQYMPNAAAAAVSMKYHLQGQAYGVVSACSGGAHAIGSALRMIQYGDADAAVTGGSEAALTAFAFACFNSMQFCPDNADCGRGAERLPNACAGCHEATDLQLATKPPQLNGLFRRKTLERRASDR